MHSASAIRGPGRTRHAVGPQALGGMGGLCFLYYLQYDPIRLYTCLTKCKSKRTQATVYSIIEEI